MLSKLIKFLIGDAIGGRLFLTYCTGITFVYITCAGWLDAKTALTVISTVFALYFTRSDRQPPTETK